tara:strand:+ start:352 stop:465 length:114 start_codon:yes stop_codon:yes gene_type:complete
VVGSDGVHVVFVEADVIFDGAKVGDHFGTMVFDFFDE